MWRGHGYRDRRKILRLLTLGSQVVRSRVKIRDCGYGTNCKFLVKSESLVKG